MISVIIPVYNREKLIEKSIQSVLNQTYRDLELIVVDDGSIDKTREVVKSINDPRLKYIYQPNQGACSARNRGIEEAKGDFIAFQDSDDIWALDKLEKQMKVFDNSDVDIVCCKTKCKRLNGSTLFTLKNVAEGIINKEMGPCGISTQTLVMKSTVTKKVKFDPNVIRYQDLDFLISAHEYYTIYCLDLYLVERYIELDSITNHPERIYKMAKYFEIKYSYHFSKSDGYLAKFFAGVLLEAGKNASNMREKFNCYRLAFKYHCSVNVFLKFLVLILGIYPLYRKIVERIDLHVVI